MSRIRANQITNQAADGAPTVQHGLIIAGVSTFTGSVSIGGTLTYEDVTNIDSVGVITARSGINVSSGNINASSGRILIGTTTEGHAEGDDLTIATSGVTGMTIRSGTGSAGNIFFSDATSGSAERQGIIRYDHADDAMKFNVNNAEKLRIDSSGRVLVGHSANLHDYQLQVLGADVNASLALSRFTNNSASSILEFHKSRNGTIGSNTIVQDGDTVGVIRFKGTDGSDYAQVADIQAQVDGTPGNNDMPGCLIFGTTADGAQYTSERLRITSAGYVQTKSELWVGGSAPVLRWRDSTHGEKATARIGGSDLYFEVANNERLRITSDGNMGLGLTPAYSGIFGGAQRTFQIGGTAAPCLRITSSTSNQADLVIHAGNSGRRADIANMTENGSISMWTKPTGGSITERFNISADGNVTKPNSCGFHMIHDGNQSLSNGDMITTWDTDASDSRSYIKNCSFNSGRFVAPVAGLYFFTAQLLLMSVATSDDGIHIIWTKDSSNSTFSYWNTRHDGSAAHGSYGYGSYLPVTGSITVYLTAGEIFGIKASFSGSISIYGTDSNWGHWSGYLVG